LFFLRETHATSSLFNIRSRYCMDVALTFNLKTSPRSQSFLSPSLLEGPSSILSGDRGDNALVESALATALADAEAEWDEEETIAAVESAIVRAGHTVHRVEANADAAARLAALRPGLVFNIAEGMGARSREAQIPAICDLLGIPHSGSDAVTLGICLDKAHTKEILAYHHIPTAPFLVARAAADVPRTLPLRYPLFVKPLHEGSSKGIFTTSVARSRDDVVQEVERIAGRYGEPSLIEEYLPGREFTVAMIGNGASARVLPIIEYNFGALPDGVPKIDSFEAKWLWDVPDQPLDSLHCPAPIPEALALRISEICLRAWRVLRIRDWARIDVRLDAEGHPHIIEVNPLPGILPRIEDNSCFPRAAREAGMDYDALIQTVLALAIARATSAAN
jgi:D-alanine-D-alanine ligase